jgi:hypothetical protein
MNNNPVMSFGRFKGQEIDVRTRRSIELLSKDNSHAIIKYFFHKSSFYIARIPLSGVTSVRGQRFSFGERDSGVLSLWGRLTSTLVNHAQVRFIFDSDAPIELFQLDNTNLEGDPVEYITDIVYSVEVVGPKGKKWSIKNSFGDLACAHRILSTEEMFFERVYLCNYIVEQTPQLPLTEQDLQHALHLIMHNSNAAGLDTPYYILTPFLRASNCTSEAFRILDTILWKRYTLKQKIIAKSLWRLPVKLELYLQLRGLHFNTDDFISINEEMKELLDRSDLKERVALVKGA